VRRARTCALGRVREATRPVVLVRVPVGHRFDVDDGPGVRRVDHAVAAHKDPDVATAGEEDEVARLEVPAPDGAAAGHVAIARVRQRDSEVAPDVAHETRAVEAGARRRAAPDIRDADEASRVLDDALAEGRRGVRRHVMVVAAVVVVMLVRVLPRELLRRRRRTRVTWQRPDKCHEEGAYEYEQQYEEAEWPHWK
jgi:hypothetical protein